MKHMIDINQFPAFIEIDFNIFNLVKAKLDPQSYVECGTCGSIKIDTPDLAAAIYKITSVLSDNDDAEAFDELNDALFEIVESEPSFDNTEEWSQWFKINEYRMWDYPHDYFEILYFAHSEVIFYHDASCECIKLHNKAYVIEKCTGDHSMHICELAGKGTLEKKGGLAKALNFMCLNCGRFADKMEKLCNPLSLEDVTFDMVQ